MNIVPLKYYDHNGNIAEHPYDEVWKDENGKVLDVVFNKEKFESYFLKEKEMKNDIINHPKHYTVHPSGIECIQVVEHMAYNLGNAIKYIWRADLKGRQIEDLKKAIWYIEREIKRINKEK